MPLNVHLFISTLIFTTITHAKDAEPVQTPIGFSVFHGQNQLKTLPKGSKALFFFHLHHCPNCALTLRHLISQKAFQKLTENVHRVVVHSGQAQYNQLYNKYQVHASPVFVLTDHNYKMISKSPYGLLSFTQFSEWFKDGKIVESESENLVREKIARAIKKVASKVDIDQSLMFLSYNFSDVAALILKKDRDRLVEDLLDYLKFQNPPSNRHDKAMHYYQRGHIFQALSLLGDQVGDRSFSIKMTKSALLNFNQITDGSGRSDLGKSIFLIYQLVKLKKDAEVESLVRQLAIDWKGKNLTALYINTAFAYGKFTGRKDCHKVLKYVNQLRFEKIPVDKDKLIYMDLKVSCLSQMKRMKEAQREFDSHLKNINSDAQTIFSKKIKKIQSYLKGA